jgi:hypothetical protein
LLQPAGQAAVLAAPEQAVVHQQRIGTRGDRGVDQARLAVTPLTRRRTSGRPSTCRPFGP